MVSRCFPGGYNVKLYISRGRLAWWLLFFCAVVLVLQFLSFSLVSCRKVCLNMYNDSICDDLDNATHKAFLNAVQKETSQWQFYSSLCYNIPSLLLIGLYGSWSDRYSRIIPLLIGPAGFFLMAFIYLLNAIFIASPVGYLLIGNFLFGCSGGLTCFLMATFSYLSIKTTRTRRTSRLSIAQAVQTFAHALALFSSGVLLDNTGYVCVYSIVLVLYLSVIVYILIFLKEPRVTEDKTSNELETLGCCMKFRRLFGVDHMKEAVMVTFQRRAGGTKKYILMMVLGWFIVQLTSGRNYNIIILEYIILQYICRI